MRFKSLSLYAIALIALATTVHAAPNWLTRPGTIGHALIQPDGTHVYLDAVMIEKIRSQQTPPYLTIRECYNASDRIVVLTSPSPQLQLGQLIDIEGVVSTLSDGSRAISDVTVYGYTDAAGNLLHYGPFIKGLLEPTPWQWKVDLTVTEGASGVSGFERSGNPETSALPSAAPAEPPVYYTEISDVLNADTAQTIAPDIHVRGGISAQTYYDGIPEVRGLPDGSLVELQCKRITGVGVQNINGTNYKYVDIAEDLPAQDWIRCYYTRDVASTGRVHRVTGQIRHTDPNTPVIDVDTGPDYNPQILVGHLQAAPRGTIAWAKTFADGQTLPAQMQGQVVTRTFPHQQCFYIQDQRNRENPGQAAFAGIRVTTQSVLPEVGRIVTLTGGVMITAEGERVIGNPTIASSENPISFRPIGLNHKLIGGGSINQYTPGMSGGHGVSNTGVFVRAFGYVRSIGSNCFYIDDGSCVDSAGGGGTGLKVDYSWHGIEDGDPPIVAPGVGWLVYVDGVSGAEGSQPPYTRVLRLRSQGDLHIIQGGEPINRNPVPSWAGAVMPTDASGVGVSGPSSADSVDLATGAGQSFPEPDISVYNPIGPDVEFTRSYVSKVAESGYASLGLTPGWFHNYDVRIEAPPGRWGDLTLILPNAVQDTLRPEVVSELPTGKFLPMGGLYVVSGEPSANMGQWLSINITFSDETTWRFEAIDPAAPYTYLPCRITDIVGHYVTISRVSFTDMRLQDIRNQDDELLMSFSYSGGYLSAVSDVSVSEDPIQVTFSYAQEAGATVLKSVSQVNNPTAQRWTYGYTSIVGQPYLVQTQAPNPTGGGGVKTHSFFYDGFGHVYRSVDANSYSRWYYYGDEFTQVLVKDDLGNTVNCWTQKLGPNAQDFGTTDANGGSTTIEYVSDYRPWRLTNKNQQQTQMTYDDYGNVRTVTNPRGLVTTYAYDDPLHPLRLTSVQEGSKTSTIFEYNAAGLLWKVKTPEPGEMYFPGRVTAATYTYTPLGNLSMALSPPNILRYPFKTVFDYTSDPDYGISGVPERLGQPLRVTVYECRSIPRIIAQAHFRYDDRGRLEEVIDADIVADPNFRHRTNFVYNEADQVTEVWYAPTGADYLKRERLAYEYVYPGGPLKNMKLYDEDGELFRQIDATNGNEAELLAQSGNILETNYAYDAMYRAKRITDGRSNVTDFGYDGAGNPRALTYPSGKTFSWGFDPDHNLNRRVDGKGQVTNYVLDPIDSRLTDIAYPTGQSPHFEYDIYGRITTMTDATGTVQYYYDHNDLIVRVVTTYNGLPRSQIIDYTYDEIGNKVQMTFDGVPGPSYPWSLHFEYTWGAVSQLFYTTGWGSSTCYFDRNGRLVRRIAMTDPVGQDTTYNYDARGRLAGINTTGDSGAGDSFFTNIKYDPAGNLIDLDYDIPNAWLEGGQPKRLYGHITYTYDDLDRLTQENRADADPAYSYIVNYSYDDADNAEQVRGLSFNYNNDNQISSATYDDNGNATVYQGGYGFGYDYEDLPTSVQGGMSNVTMTYRADGLRAWKSVGGSKTYYLYDGDLPVCELDDQGNLRVINGFGPPGLMTRKIYGDPGVQWFHHYTYDPMGSLVKVIYRKLFEQNPITSCNRTAVFDAFGKRVWDKNGCNSGPYPSGAPATFVDCVGFHGQWGAYTDPETRVGESESPLVLMGVRYYDSTTARFVSRDPLGVNVNDYAFCENNPVGWADPSGAATIGQVLSWPFRMLGAGVHWVGATAWKGVKAVACSGTKVKSIGLEKAAKVNPELQAEFPEYAARQRFVSHGIGPVVGKVTDEVAATVIGTIALSALGEFANAKLADRHYLDHGAEFGNVSKQWYLTEGKNFFLRNSSNQEWFIRGAKCTRGTPGDLVMFDKATGEFGVMAKNGTLRTFFKPTKGYAYFLNQMKYK